MIFNDGIDLPEFAAFPLFKSKEGRERIKKYYRGYLELARKHRVGYVLESLTWRASRSWGEKLGVSPAELDEYNRIAIELLAEVRDEYDAVVSPIVLSGCMGPRGDGYSADITMTEAEAEKYHRAQVASFAATEADLVAVFTMNYTAEAIGVARAAVAEKMPVVVSFTVETDGRLPSGETLREAIEKVDAATGAAPAYYMVNCAHPTHFVNVLEAGAPWVERIRAVRANASKKSHAELDESTELDIGDLDEFGAGYRELKARLTNLTVVGGCCGTDVRHVGAVCGALL